MPPLSREAIFGVLSGLTLLGCDKSPSVAAEPASSPAAAASGNVAAKEVPSAAGSAEKAHSCSPGGCAPGKCGGGEKK